MSDTSFSIQDLQFQAIANSFFRPTTLKRAINRLGFVQADPIRAPARAQDLILRHRVNGYQAGDLEKLYPKLSLEEDFLYAYGFMPQSTWQLLHSSVKCRLSAPEKRVLEVVSHHRQVHPRELEAYLGSKREINAWGGYSKATTRTLERLHRRGILRVARRENGIRLYEVANTECESISTDERLRGLVLLIANMMAPMPRRSLQTMVSYAGRDIDGRLTAVRNMIHSGELSSAEVDHVHYVWPTGWLFRKTEDERVRFLAPFDPLVWDRRRFEHLWGWRYRFEAYTPASKRKLGYYAMPLLWRRQIVGWVNVSLTDGQLSAQPGFVNGTTPDAPFQKEFEAEEVRFREFMGRDRAL